MVGDFLNKKGQLSFEFIIILTLILLYISTIIQPTAIISQALSRETIGLGNLTLSAQKLASTIDFVQLSGGSSKQTITVFVPKNGVLYCNSSTATDNPLTTSWIEKPNTIDLNYQMGYPITAQSECSADASNTYYCLKTFPLESGAEINCNGFANGLHETGLVKIVAEKFENSDVIKVRVTGS